MIEETISHYRLLSKLGAGGMGEVYLARDIHLDREVAIKFPSSASLDENDRARFMREARLASTFQHPNIATIFDFGETSDHRPFLVIELVRGRSLHELIKKKELSLSRSVEICLDVAKALTEAHSHGILHRDIKPSNIVINNRGAVKVLDFGLAKQLKLKDVDLSGAPTFSEDASLTARGVILGTPAYMSPEQVSDGELDERSDLYSLGVTLYECATGVPPFKGGSIEDLCTQVLNTEPKKPSGLNPAITPEVESVILRAISKDPNSRYGSLLEFADALKAAAPSLTSAETRKFEHADQQPVQPGLETESLGGTSQAPKEVGALPVARTKVALRKPYLMGLAMVSIAALMVVAIVIWPRPTTAGLEARNLFDRGVEALHNGSILTAKNLLTEAVQTNDSWPIAHARLAEAWFDLDNVEMASRSITAAHARAQKGPKLTPEEDLYLKAITSTVDLKHTDSVKSLDGIEKLHPDNADVIFDAARSLERAGGTTDDVIAKFEKALALNSRNPAVHLRLGVLYGRKQDVTRANEHFDRAREIYQSQQSSEGVTEVSIQRGAMNARVEKFELARPDFEAALKQAKSEVPNAYQEIRSLIQLSVVDSQTGKLESAEQLALEAFNRADGAGLDYVTTAGRVVLGDVYFRMNRLTKAEEYTAKALQLAERYRVPRWIAASSFNLGSIRIYQNRSTEGLDLIKKAKEFYDRMDNPKRSLDALTMIARTQRNLGDYGGAQKTIEAQLAAIGKSDAALLAQVLFDFAYLKFVIEDFANASKYYQEASDLYRKQKSKPSLFLALGGLAASEAFLGRRREADRDLAEARSLASEASMRIDLLPQEARIALVNRSFPAAVSKTNETLKGTDESDRTTRVVAMISLSTALLGLGRHQEAEKQSRQAIEIARGFEGRRLLALAQLALAEALSDPSRARADWEEARSLALEAQREFTRGGQTESAWRALHTAAFACAGVGDSSNAREYARQANALLVELAREPSYEAYRSRPDVKYKAKQLEELLSVREGRAT